MLNVRAMSQPTCARSIETVLERDLMGRVPIGEYVLLVGASQGAILQISPSLPSASEQPWRISHSSVYPENWQNESLNFPAAAKSVEQELGRALTSAQLVTLQELWQHLEGHTQLLLQIAAFARENRFSLDQILFRIQQEDAVRSLTRLVLSPLPRAQRWIVALLTAMKGMGIRADQIAAMIGPPNPQPSLQDLLQRRLIQAIGNRYYLASELGEVLQDGFNPVPWMERAIAHFLAWSEQHQRSPQVILEERQLLMFVLKWAVQQQRWQDVLQLARAIERTFALSKLWEDWEKILRWSMQAAWKLEDERSEAWALHQLGTLAFCQERITFAYDTLMDALKLRKALGDELGTQVTQHNINQLKAAIVPPQAQSSPKRRIYLVFGAIAVFGLVLLGSAIVWQSEQSVPTPVKIDRQ